MENNDKFLKMIHGAKHKFCMFKRIYFFNKCICKYIAYIFNYY